MLYIDVPITDEMFDDEKQEFILPEYRTLQLEHSLVSISKWESKWHKPFLHTADKTEEETIDYIKCMTITQNVNPDIYNRLTRENIMAINDYIGDPMTATTFKEEKGGKANKEIITSEVIYYWMIALQIPVEFQKWHLNRLLTLVRVCKVKNQPDKKMSKRDIMSRNAALNAKNRARFNSKG